MKFPIKREKHPPGYVWVIILAYIGVLHWPATAEWYLHKMQALVMP